MVGGLRPQPDTRTVVEPWPPSLSSTAVIRVSIAPGMAAALEAQYDP
jgi:hypothetical protein